MSRRSAALTSDWWIERRHQSPVRGALERAFLYHWSEQVEAELNSNHRHGRSPSSWEELSKILFAEPPKEGLVEADLKNLASPIGQLVVAQAVGCEQDDLSPSIERWLQTTVANLLELPLDDIDAAEYVAYRLRRREQDSAGEEAHPAEAVPESVSRVASKLDEILLAEPS